VLQGFDSNVHQQTRQVICGEDMLSHLRRQAASRAQESSAAIEDESLLFINIEIKPGAVHNALQIQEQLPTDIKN